jgi:hypothetical protein
MTETLETKDERDARIKALVGAVLEREEQRYFPGSGAWTPEQEKRVQAIQSRVLARQTPARIETKDVSAIALSYLRPLCRELMPDGYLSARGTHWISRCDPFKICLRTGRAFNTEQPENRHTIFNSNVISLWHLMRCGGTVPDIRTDWTISGKADLERATQGLMEWLGKQIDIESGTAVEVSVPEDEKEWERNGELSEILAGFLRQTGRTEFVGSAESIRKLATRDWTEEKLLGVPEFVHYKPFSHFLRYTMAYPADPPWFEITLRERKKVFLWRIVLPE